MMKQHLVAWTTVISALLCAPFATAQRARLDDLTADYHISRSDAAAAIVLADSLHMSERDIVLSARDCGRGVFDVAPAFVLGNYAGESVDRVWRQRDGRKWLDYALDLRMDLRAFNRLDVREDDFDHMMWVNLLDGAYGCSVTLWDDMRGRGLNDRDALVTIVLAGGDPYYCDQIFCEWRRCHYDWAPVFVWFVAFDLDFGHGHGYGRHDYRHDRDYRIDRGRDDGGRIRGEGSGHNLYDSRVWGSRGSNAGAGYHGDRTSGAGSRDRGSEHSYSGGNSRDRGSDHSYSGGNSGRGSDRSSGGGGHSSDRSSGGGGRGSDRSSGGGDHSSDRSSGGGGHSSDHGGHGR